MAHPAIEELHRSIQVRSKPPENFLSDIRRSVPEKWLTFMGQPIRQFFGRKKEPLGALSQSALMRRALIPARLLQPVLRLQR